MPEIDMERSSGFDKNRWQRLFFVRRTAWKTTWKFRLLLGFILLVSFFSFKGFIGEKAAQSLVCAGSASVADVAVIENYDPNYLLFENASTLLRKGVAGKVYVPVKFNRERTGANRVSQGIAELMVRISRIREYEILLIDEKEPIRLNAVRQLREQLQGRGIKSIVVISPGFCSRRSLMVYQSVFDSGDVEISCLPVFGDRNPSNWAESWHGIQEVFLEFGKLWYYRLWVLG